MKKRTGLIAALTAIAAAVTYVLIKKKKNGDRFGTKLLQKGKKMMGGPKIGEG